MKEYSLGIDTSNYKTSVAIVDKNDNIIYDERIFLTVPEGALGLRQQDALFQHIENLPGLLKGAVDAAADGTIVAVSASNKPRPINGSYMPCFIAGENQCKVIASFLGCQDNYFSHQEGHLAAASRYTELKDKDEYIFFHFSGGTTEILKYKKGDISILGGSLDISFGQLLDRVGSKMDFSFPAGARLDQLAYEYSPEETYKNLLPVIKIKNLEFNVSGIETAAIKLIGEIDNRSLAFMLMERVQDCIERIIKAAAKESGTEDFLFAGGVSASTFIRNRMDVFGKNNENLILHFSEPELSSDNAVGIAFLGGDRFWRASL